MLKINAAFGAVLFVSVSSSFAWAEAPVSPVVGRVVSAKGEVTIQGSAGKKIVKGQSVVRIGDRILTAPGSSAQVELGKNDSAMLIKPSSDVKVELSPKGEWIVTLASGGVLSSVRNPSHQPGHFSLRTRSATMGVRGTVFFAKSEPGKPLFFCDCQGTVDVTQGSDQKQFVSKHHDSPRMIDEGANALGDRIKPMPQGYDIDHSDAEIAALNKILGRR